MNAIQKKKWIKALLSGEYKQGTGKLHSKEKNTFCCLGVAVDIKIAKAAPNFDELTSHSFLPEQIQLKLANMNDKRVPFEVMAGFIEQWVEPTR